MTRGAKFIIFLMAFVSQWATSSVYMLPGENSRLLGQPSNYHVEVGDTLYSIARYHDVGLNALMLANGINDPSNVQAGSKLIIPKQMLLPFAQRKGIVINIAEMRLYYFPPNEQLVYVFPVGVGKQGLATPKVVSFIGEKRENPIWRPTLAMRERYFKQNGKPLAKEVLPGKNNPFGKYALRLATSNYLIHGTNRANSVGTRASSGCIRMYDDDIEWLYHNIVIGTQVRIVNQPVKMSYEPDQRKLIEVHFALQDFPSDVVTIDSPSIKAFVNQDEQIKSTVSELLAQPTGLVSQLSIR